MTQRRKGRTLRGPAYIVSLITYAALLYALPHPANVYVALLAGVAGAVSPTPLWGALEAGLAGLTGHLALLALSGAPEYLEGLARVVGVTPIVIGLAYSSLTLAGVAVVAWHAARALRGRLSRGKD